MAAILKKILDHFTKLGLKYGKKRAGGYGGDTKHNPNNKGKR